MAANRATTGVKLTPTEPSSSEPSSTEEESSQSEERSFWGAESSSRNPKAPRPGPPSRGLSWAAAPEQPRFYIDVDVSRGWPFSSGVAFCKFGITRHHIEVRRRKNQKALRERWDIRANLEVCFLAGGPIVEAEKEIGDYTQAIRTTLSTQARPTAQMKTKAPQGGPQ